MGNLFKNKLFNIALIIIIAITLLGVVTLFLWRTYLNPTSAGTAAQEMKKEVSAAEFQKVTYETEEIRTNLATGTLIVAKFAIQADGENAKHELELRKAQVSNIIIRALSSMKPDDIKDAKGIDKMQETMKKDLNGVMQEGKVVQVITTNKIVDL
jgi:flagellar protein FliL